MTDEKDFYFRMPTEMHSAIAELAHANGNSLTGEICSLLAGVLRSRKLISEEAVEAVHDRLLNVRRKQALTRLQLRRVVARVAKAQPKDRDIQDLCRAFAAMLKTLPLSEAEKKAAAEYKERQIVYRREYRRKKQLIYRKKWEAAKRANGDAG